MKTLASAIALLSFMSISAFAESKPKILVVVSGSEFVSTKEGGKHPTGYFLPELAGPVAALLKAGYEITYANPNGAAAVMDRISDDPRWFEDEEEYRAAKHLVESQSGLKTPKRLSSLTDHDLARFSGILVPGGHAPMEDLANDQDMGRVLRHFHSLSKPTALICHGPVALLSAKSLDRAWVYQDYRMTGFSTTEEKQEEQAGVFGGQLLFYLEDELLKAGGKVVVSKPWTSNVIRDRELITGQNPMSEKAFTALLLEALTAYRLADGSIHGGAMSRRNRCLSEAKLQARIFSAKENNLPVSTIRVLEWFFVEEVDGVLYYGIRLDTYENVNIGLRKNDCVLAHEPNYVTDGF
ncbi:MAG: type 1 glutamine amidotransferase domain-containing protein [Bdellovibrionota bacterium]